MTISDFKQVAKSRGGFYDNSHKAGENWARTWGLTWWRDVWFYKEFRLNNLVIVLVKYVCVTLRIHVQSASLMTMKLRIKIFVVPLQIFPFPH